MSKTITLVYFNLFLDKINSFNKLLLNYIHVIDEDLLTAGFKHVYVDSVIHAPWLRLMITIDNSRAKATVSWKVSLHPL